MLFRELGCDQSYVLIRSRFRTLLEQKMNYAIQARDAKVLVLRILPKVSGYKRHDAYNDLLMGIFNTLRIVVKKLG